MWTVKKYDSNKKKTKNIWDEKKCVEVLSHKLKKYRILAHKKIYSQNEKKISRNNLMKLYETRMKWNENM